jgi:hypothetical protein
MSVGTATGYGLDGQSSIPDRSKIFLFSMASRPNLRPTQNSIQRVPGDLSQGVKRVEGKAGHSPSSSAEVKNV